MKTVALLYILSITCCVATSLGNIFTVSPTTHGDHYFTTKCTQRSHREGRQRHSHGSPHCRQPLLNHPPRGGGSSIPQSSNRLDPLNFVGRAMKENAADGSSSRHRTPNVPALVYTLNSSTKWVVAIAHTIAVWSRPRNFIAPYIVVGSIGAVYFTDAIKQVINQSRPSGAPIADPGMPSSHSLVTFFAAAAWITAAACNGRLGLDCVSLLLLGSASTVAILRVVCGYHSVAQVVVGAGLGSILGKCWVWLGETVLFASNPHLAYWISWSAYLSGSVFFIGTNIRHWVAKDAHH